MVEEWRPIKNWPYEVSNLGRVRRTAYPPPGSKGRNTYPGRILNPCLEVDGYLRAHLRNGKGRSLRIYVHVLVADAFLSPRPSPAHKVAHGDGVRANCALSNLTWKTPKENFADRLLHGTYPTGELGPGAKLTWPQVLEIRRVYKKEMGRKIVRRGVAAALMKRFRIGKSTLLAIVNGDTWKDGNTKAI